MREAGRDTGRERGFALPAALLALIALTAMATAGFLASLVELRIAEAHGSGVRAYLAARAGLEDAIGSAPEGLGDTTVLEIPPSDTAVVDALPLLALSDGGLLFLLRSEGSAGSPARGRARRSLRAVLRVAAPDTTAGPETPVEERPGSRFELFPP